MFMQPLQSYTPFTFNPPIATTELVHGGFNSLDDLYDVEALLALDFPDGTFDIGPGLLASPVPPLAGGIGSTSSEFTLT